MTNPTTTADELIVPVHLAEIIQDEMKERGWSMTDLVMNMGPFFTERDWGICQLSWEFFFSAREPYVVLGDTMAKQLATAFDVSPEFFTNLHEGWRKAVQKEASDD